MRDPTKEELEKFGLLYQDGTPMRYAFEGTAQVFWNPSDPEGEDEITYRLYSPGTNMLRAIKYNPHSNEWTDAKEILPDTVLYGLLWKICINQHTGKQV